jgi:DNA-binding CsgD family transcriptional regulator
VLGATMRGGSWSAAQMPMYPRVFAHVVGRALRNWWSSMAAEAADRAASGMSSPEIAEQLLISSGTVKTHFGNIYDKWAVSNRAAAGAEALRRGFID